MMHWITPVPLGHLARSQRVALLAALQAAIRRDQRSHGSLAALALVGTALGYCASLLEAVPMDPDGDVLDHSQAQLEGELRLLLCGLHAGMLYTEDAALRADVQAFRQRLLPVGGPEDALVLARAALVLAARQPDPNIFDRLMLTPLLGRLVDAVRQVEVAQARCAAAAALEGQDGDAALLDVAVHARQTTRFGDDVIRRLVGIAGGLVEPGDPATRERALRLLQPLWEASLAPDALPSLSLPPAAVREAPSREAPTIDPGGVSC